MFVFDEHQACLQQNQRKDSASSEVAALLCISGRTSRISSIGSQGSAVSRLSAVSGVSRSPSPHKMLMETSFCGPKPLDNAWKANQMVDRPELSAETLEQVLLARKQDPTEAMLDADVRKQMEGRELKREDKMEKHAIPIPKPTNRGRSSSRSSAASPSTVVGTTPQGTSYIRIKLKPDHLYSDNGLGPNERVVEDVIMSGNTNKKPATLSLTEGVPKKASKHFSQLVKADDAITMHPVQPNRLNPSNASPKPSRHNAIRDAGSRSPSPGTTSRKNSFCSLFKFKDSTTPDSPGQQRKKSSGFLGSNDQPRDRSRSKSRDSERSTSVNNTPSKQRSVLAIFKPKKAGSKSTSPVDPEAMSSIANVSSHTTPDNVSTPKSRLRYYDTPPDVDFIHIPLHTPPDEKDGSLCTVDVIKERRLNRPVETNGKPGSVSSQPQRVQPKKGIPSNPKFPSHIEYEDGSIRIPLKSPTDETKPNRDLDIPATICKLEPQERVMISTQAPSQHVVENTKCSNSTPRHTTQEKVCKLKREDTIQCKEEVIDRSPSISTRANIVQHPNTVPMELASTATSTTATATYSVVNQSTSVPVCVPSATSKEKKRILFATKIGSGSDEQLFATQLSLSKTESLCSQLSEQASIDSPNGVVPMESAITVAEKSQTTNQLQMELEIKKNVGNEISKYDDAPITVTMRGKDAFDSNGRKCPKPKVLQELPASIRHSKFIENIDEILEKEKQLDIVEAAHYSSPEDEESGFDRTESVCTVRRGHNPEFEIPAPPKGPVPVSTLTEGQDKSKQLEEFAQTAGGSTESERDIDDQSSCSKHMARCQLLGAAEEESTGLVGQVSFEDELPYIPTTLPEERSQLVSLIPVKERSTMDIKTCPVERPRSTTPMNPSCIEAYCESMHPFDEPDISDPFSRKLKISLPRRESRERGPSSSKSPRRASNTSGKSWFEFAEQGIGGTPTSAGLGADFRNPFEEDPPPLPARKPQNVSQWINFENIPEKRKPPKRIQTLPSKDSGSSSSHKHGGLAGDGVNFVNPEECQCECHETERDGSSSKGSADVFIDVSEDAQPLLREGSTDRKTSR